METTRTHSQRRARPRAAAVAGRALLAVLPSFSIATGAPLAPASDPAAPRAPAARVGVPDAVRLLERVAVPTRVACAPRDVLGVRARCGRATARPRGATAVASRDRPDRETREAVDALEAQLGEERHARRRSAVRKLAEFGTERAWTLVIEALADPRAEVADEAQWQLGRLEHPGLDRALFGRDGLGSRDPWVQARVAEALGRMPLAVDPDRLLPGGGREPLAVSRMLLWSLERRARRGALGDGLRDHERRGLARAVEDLAERRGGDPALRADALAALAEVDPDRARGLLGRFEDARDARCRCAAITLGVELEPGDAALDRARRLAADEDRSVRAAALVAVEDLGLREGLALLVDRLEAEPRARTKRRALDALQRLSGLKHRDDPRPWRAWIASLPADWRPARASLGPAKGGTAAFAGLPLLSDRLAFLIDFSGSLWIEREGRGTRKQEVDRALAAALPRLDAEARFLLVPYTADEHPWREELVPATERAVREALAWFEACTERGSGDAWGAMMRALAEPDVDTLVLLTDGAPTGGRRWKLDLIAPLLLHELRFRPVALDLVLVDASPGLARRWKALSAATGGLCVEVSL